MSLPFPPIPNNCSKMPRVYVCSLRASSVWKCGLHERELLIRCSFLPLLHINCCMASCLCSLAVECASVVQEEETGRKNLHTSQEKWPFLLRSILFCQKLQKIVFSFYLFFLFQYASGDKIIIGKYFLIWYFLNLNFKLNAFRDSDIFPGNGKHAHLCHQVTMATCCLIWVQVFFSIKQPMKKCKSYWVNVHI